MTLDFMIVAVIVSLAALYLGYYTAKKIRRFRDKTVGPCGHSCENCPFAKNGQTPCQKK
ncbi:MAG: hypothetical protein J6S69_05430 [Proteobacteria bacterium]|jgi:hypothetical protein|nr:hypothetical protein [Pseudomonadota bacterium]